MKFKRSAGAVRVAIRFVICKSEPYSTQIDSIGIYLCYMVNVCVYVFARYNDAHIKIADRRSYMRMKRTPWTGLFKITLNVEKKYIQHDVLIRSVRI